MNEMKHQLIKVILVIPTKHFKLTQIYTLDVSITFVRLFGKFFRPSFEEL